MMSKKKRHRSEGQGGGGAVPAHGGTLAPNDAILGCVPDDAGDGKGGVASAAGAAAHPPCRTLPLWLMVAVVCALGAAVYGRTLTFDWVRLDDNRFILERRDTMLSASLMELASERYGDLTAQDEFYYRPLVTFSYALDARLGDMSPRPFHATNLALHLLASCLLLFLVRRLEASDRVALALASVFVVHPAHVESVAWIPGRNDTLLGLFLFSSWLMFLQYRSQGHAWRLGVHLALFFCALLTKESAVAFPVVLLGQILVAERRGPRWRAEGRVLLGWGLTMAAWLLLRSAIPAPEQPPLLPRMAEALRHLPVLFLFLGKALIPTDLAVLANVRDSSWLPAIIAVVVCALACVHLPRGARPGMLIGSFTFLAFLGPSLLVSDNLLLENRLYVPIAGVLIAAAARLGSGAWLPSRVRLPRAAALAAAIALLLLLGARSFTYAADFRDPDAFGDACLRTSPGNSLALLIGGNALMRRGEVSRAEQAFRGGIALGPPIRAMLHNNIGVIHLRREQFAEAEQEFRQELLINPAAGLVHSNLGYVLVRQGRESEAMQAWKRAVEYRPNDRDALLGLLVLSTRAGDQAQAAVYERQLERLGVRPRAPPPR